MQLSKEAFFTAIEDPKFRATKSPLEGIIVLDLAIITAGANASAVLGDFGATVLKIESCRHFDPFRQWDDTDTTSDGWNRAPTFHQVNRNKLGLTLDLITEEGRNIFLKLAELADVVVENFRRGVMEKLSLGYDVLSKINPRLILGSLTSQGLSGPESRYGSYGSTLETLSGLSHLTGYENDSPLFTGRELNYIDQIVSIFGAGAIMTALYHRKTSHRGTHVEISQRELGTAIIGEHILASSANSEEYRRKGNQREGFIIHNCFPCKGDDAWITITVRTDIEWVGLCKAIDCESLLNDPNFEDIPSRKRHRKLIEQEIESWSRNISSVEAMHLLQEYGVPCGALLSGKDRLEDPHFKSREFIETPKDFSSDIPGVDFWMSFPAKFNTIDTRIRRPAPKLGEHNQLILCKGLGMSEDAFNELESNGVIGTVPHS